MPVLTFGRDKVSALRVIQGPAGDAGDVDVSATSPLEASTSGTVSFSVPQTDGYALLGNGASNPSFQGFTGSGTGAEERTWSSALDDRRFNVKNFGAVGDGVTDDTDAIEAAFAAMSNAMAQVTVYPTSVADYVANSNAIVFFPAGTYILTRSIDCQALSPTAWSHGWGIVGEGAMIVASCAGKPAFDCLGSTFGNFRDFTVIGDVNTPPGCAFTLGRRDALGGDVAGHHTFSNVHTSGAFTVAPLLLSASEVNAFFKCSFVNLHDDAGASYAAILDGVHHFDPPTDFTASNATPDTNDAFGFNTFINCTFAKYPNGTAIWCARPTFFTLEDCYLQTFDGSPGIVHYQIISNEALSAWRINIGMDITTAGGFFAATSAIEFQSSIPGSYIQAHGLHFVGMISAQDSILATGTNMGTLALNHCRFDYRPPTSLMPLHSGGGTLSYLNTRVNGILHSQTVDDWLVIGHTARISSENSGQGPLQLHDNASSALCQVFSWRNTVGGAAQLILAKSRSDTIGTHALGANGDRIGEIYFQASDGTNFDSIASIRALFDGTPNTNDVPGLLVFCTTAAGAHDPTDRWIIDKSGTLKPASDGAYDIGTTALGVNNLFFDTGAVINFENGDVTITHAANALTFAGASSGYTFDAATTIGTGNAFTCGSIELGHASANTLTASGGHMTIEGATVWDSGNDGTGTGLDADLLDGKNTGTSGNAVPLLDGTNTWSGKQTISLATLPFQVTSTEAAASVQTAIFEGDRAASNADNDEAYISFQLSDDGGTQKELARQSWIATDVNAGTSVDGNLQWSVMTAGTLADELQLSGTALFPVSNDGLALGIVNTNAFSDLALADGAVIDWSNSDLTLTHSSNTLSLTGGNLSSASSIFVTNNTNGFFLDTSFQCGIYRNASNQLVFRGGGAATDRGLISATNFVWGTAAIATDATDGFLYIPSCAGTPTGTPTTFTGRVPLVVDTTNHKLYFYDGSWRDAGP